MRPHEAVVRDRGLLALEAGDVAEILSRVPAEVTAAVLRAFEGAPDERDLQRGTRELAGSASGDGAVSVQGGWLGLWLARGRGRVLLEARQVALASASATAELVAPALAVAPREVPRLGLVGCDELNGAVLDGLLRAWPKTRHVMLWDPAPSRRFAFLASRRCALRGRQVWLACDAETLLRQSDVVSVATPGAVELGMWRSCKPGSVLVNLCAEGLDAPLQRHFENVFEDPGARRATPRIATLRAVIRAGTLRRGPQSVAVFHRSPRSRADLAVARLVAEVAMAEGRGQWLQEFFSAPSALPGPLFAAPRTGRPSLHAGDAR